MQRQTKQRPARGFSLIELMVGLVIGMIAVIVMMQVLSVSEGYKRTTTGGDSAQNNGAIALYGLQRDLRQAGYGLSAATVIGCNLTLRTGVTVSSLGPVVINPALPTGAQDPNTDSLLVFYGSANDAQEGDLIGGVAAPTYTLDSFLSTGGTPAILVGDKVVAQAASRSSPCNLSVESVTAVSGRTVTVGSGVSTATGGALFNLGSAPKVVVYAVKDRTLRMCDYEVNDCGATTYNAAHWVPVASNVVNLRAEYGHDTSAPMNGTVDAFDGTTPATSCGWLRMRAVAVVLVARSAQLEKDNVTTAAPTWSRTGTSPIDLSDDAEWQRYRYKTFETIVPLRNMAWMDTSQPGC